MWGSGAARATVNGAMRVLSVELSPALVLGMAAEDKTRNLAASLIADAVNHVEAAFGQTQADMTDYYKGELPGVTQEDLDDGRSDLVGSGDVGGRERGAGSELLRNLGAR